MGPPLRDNYVSEGNQYVEGMSFQLGLLEGIIIFIVSLFSLGLVARIIRGVHRSPPRNYIRCSYCGTVNPEGEENCDLCDRPLRTKS